MSCSRPDPRRVGGGESHAAVVVGEGLRRVGTSTLLIYCIQSFIAYNSPCVSVVILSFSSLYKSPERGKDYSIEMI